MQSRLVASATATETTLADADNDPPYGDDGVVWCTADQLDDDDGEKLSAVVGGSGNERNRNRHDDDNDDDDNDNDDDDNDNDNDDDNDDDDDDNDNDDDDNNDNVRRKMPAVAMVGGSHPRTRGGVLGFIQLWYVDGQTIS